MLLLVYFLNPFWSSEPHSILVDNNSFTSCTSAWCSVDSHWHRLQYLILPFQNRTCHTLQRGSCGWYWQCWYAQLHFTSLCLNEHCRFEWQSTRRRKAAWNTPVATTAMTPNGRFPKDGTSPVTGKLDTGTVKTKGGNYITPAGSHKAVLLNHLIRTNKAVLLNHLVRTNWLTAVSSLSYSLVSPSSLLKDLSYPLLGGGGNHAYGITVMAATGMFQVVFRLRVICQECINLQPYWSQGLLTV